MLKIIIGKLERKKKVLFFIYLFFSFKLKKLTQNPKTELKRIWIGLDSGTK